jgi:hypothetical protein
MGQAAAATVKLVPPAGPGVGQGGWRADFHGGGISAV